jgi:hypothetical protein
MKNMALSHLCPLQDSLRELLGLKQRPPRTVFLLRGTRNINFTQSILEELISLILCYLVILLTYFALMLTLD